MNLRYRLLLFFSVTLLLQFSISLISSHLNRQNFDQANHLLRELHQTLHISADLQLHLQAERTAWKNVLLRGTETGKYHEYLSAFYAEERKVRKGIKELIAIFGKDREIGPLLTELQRAHLALGRVLRHAISTFNITADNPHLVADQIAGKMELDPDRLITRIVLQIEQHQHQQTVVLNQRLERKELTLLLISLAVAVSAAVLFIWLVDRQIGKPAQQAAFLANYDPLTKLPNRTLFQDRLQHAMDQADRSMTQVALLFCDLDHFKTVNDALGHHTGDELLKQVAKRLRNSLRKSDTPARLGGDEFAVILEGVGSENEVANVAEHIRLALQQPFNIFGQESHVSASIGITFYPEDGKDSESLLKNADAAMYLAKESGRNAYHFFTDDLNQVAAHRMEMENLLRHALKEERFELHFQPQVALDSSRILGAEALLRLQSEQVMIQPMEFIPVLEESGMMADVGNWVLRQACLQAAEWQGLCGGDFRIAVNLSACQLQNISLVDQIDQALDDSGLPPHCLELEITEHNLIEARRSSDILQQIDALGVRLAIDDFGTGYSSLSYLKRFSVDVLKIDRSFIRDISHDHDDDAVTSAIIALAHKLSMEVIAEGVELPEQLAFLRAQGCDSIQGYLVSHPLPAHDLRQWMLHTQSGDLPTNWLTPKGT